MSRKIRSLTLVLALCLPVIGGLVGPGSASAGRTAGILLFVAPSSRVVAAGQTEQVWVHTMAQASVTLTVDYGNGQRLTQHGTTGSGGLYLFRWSVGYTGSSVVQARYWVRVVRGNLSTAARGTFVLRPAPPLQVRLEVLTPSLNVGETLRVRVHSRPGARLTLSVRGADGHPLLTRTAQAGRTGDWLVSVPISTTVTRQQRLRIVASGYDLGRRASATGFLTLWPRPILWNTITPGSPIPAAHSASLAAARRAARTAAAGSLAAAQSNARTAVQAITVDLQVLAQWTTAAPPHSVAYYQDLLARAHSYNDAINVTAQALADDAQVEARMHDVMPPKAIMVSLAEQALRAYQDGRLVLFTYVTTGGPELPTPPGHYQILARYSPFTFVSPYPVGSPWWYAPSPATWAMLFQANGYFIHDAPWRTFYGPGSNVVYGAPGTNTGGSHGCVNTPYAAMARLWNWTPIGTPVVVYGGPSVAPGVGGI